MPGEKGLQGICGQQRPRSACASANADKGLRCPLIESFGVQRAKDLTKYAHAQVDLNLSIFRTLKNSNFARRYISSLVPYAKSKDTCFAHLYCCTGLDALLFSLMTDFTECLFRIAQIVYNEDFRAYADRHTDNCLVPRHLIWVYTVCLGLSVRTPMVNMEHSTLFRFGLERHLSVTLVL